MKFKQSGKTENRFRYLFMWLIFVLFYTNSYGQSFRVSGNVTDVLEGNTLPGVNIIEQGTSNGTVTDINGDYQISVSSGESVLIFSYVGYSEDTVPVNRRSKLDVSLYPNIEMLSEMVVVGYGVQKKNDLTGSVSVVSSEDLMTNNPANLGQALQGRAAGVSVTSNSGQPGANSSIKVRGIGSISGGADPLFVIDGMIVDNPFIINTINPADIESVSVLKDASSTAIYGARGANGVIVMETKRGKEGQTEVNFSTYGGITQTPGRYDLMNADEYATFMQDATNSFIERNPNFPMPEYFTDESRQENGARDTDWQNQILQQGVKQNHDLSLKGGTERFNYLFSTNYYDETGTTVNTAYNRITARFNSELDATDWLTLGQTFSFGQENNDYTSHRGRNPWSTATLASPFMPVYNEDKKGGYEGPEETITGPNDQTNPFAEQMLNTNQQRFNQLLATFYGNAELLKGLTYRVEIGVNNREGKVYRFSPEYELARAWSNESSELTEASSTGLNLLINNLITYQNSINGHNFSVLLGQSGEKYNMRNLSVTGNNISFDKNVMSLAQTITTAGGTEIDERYTSYFFRGTYDFEGKYLFTGTFRRDGSSKFGPENRIGYFPSFSVGWKFNEDLFPDAEQVEMMKLRVGWGQTGNDNIGNYLYVDRINNPLETRYPFGSEENIFYGGTIIRSFANPFIKWEASEMTNIGLDAWLFEAKVELTLEYYYKSQNDMLIEMPQYHFFGRQQESGRLAVNIGEVVNQGIEFNAAYKKMEGDFNYRVNLNMTTINNKVQFLPNDEPVFGPNGNTITMVGEPIGSFYGWVAEGIFQIDDFQQDENGDPIISSTGNYSLNEGVPDHARGTSPGDIRFRDLDGDSVITSSDRQIIGNPFPDFIYGLNLDLYYKDFDMVIFMEGVYGNEIYNHLRSNIGVATEPLSQGWNRLSDAQGFWTHDNPSETMTRAFLTDPNDNARMSSWFVEDGSYLRLRNIQIGYTLPQELLNRIGMNRARLYISASNLFTLTGYSGLDPELNASNPLQSGFDFGTYPVPKSYMIGLQIGI